MKPTSFAWVAAGVVAGFLGLSAIFGSFYTVDQGELAVVTRNGAFQSVEHPGWHYKLPFFDSVTTISLRDQTVNWDGEHFLAIYTADQQPANTQWTVQYRADPASAKEIYERFGSLDGAANRILISRFPNAAKAVFGQYTAKEVVDQRAKLVVEVTEAVNSATVGTGLIVTAVNMQDVDFSQQYDDAVEARMQAEVEVQRLRQNAERVKVEAQITVTKAQAEADAKRATADADAYSTRARGEAEAASINARGKALRDNPDLVGLVTAEKWNGTLPTTMVPSASVPFVNVR